MLIAIPEEKKAESKYPFPPAYVKKDVSKFFDESVDAIFENFKRIFILHVRTLTSDSVVHEALGDVYPKMFEFVHKISERKQALNSYDPIEWQDAVYEAFVELESAEKTLKEMVSEENSIGTDTLLRDIANDMEWIIGKAKGLIKE